MITKIIKVEPTEGQKNRQDQIRWALVGTLLIIGPFESHLILVMSGLYPDLKMKHRTHVWENLEESVRTGVGEILAAGTFWGNGDVMSWGSYFLNVKTPFRLREKLYSVISDTILNEPKWRQE